MMMLGPALMLLACFEHARGAYARLLATFGQVPFFYYVVHIYLIHALAVATGWPWHSYAHAGDRLRSSGRLYCLAPGARPALSDLPLVCSAEGEWQGMVVEYSMTRISSIPQFTMELEESRWRMQWE